MLIIYLFNRFIFRLQEFLRHWYIDGFFAYKHIVFSFLGKLDKFFALKITWRYLFQPLYQDRNFLGYILGFIFRFGRLLMSGFIYLIIIAVALVLYLVWMTIPAYAIYKIII